MKLLKVKAKGFKNCIDGFEIDLVPRAKKTSEDKEYEIKEIAEGLYVFNTAAFVGKNASGKTTAIELLDCCYSILGDFRLEGKHYDYDGIELEMFFIDGTKLYKYTTKLKSEDSMNNKARFVGQKLYSKPYYKSKLKQIYDDKDYVEYQTPGVLPDDTSILFFVLQEQKTRALFFDSFTDGADTYQMAFKAMKNYKVSDETFMTTIKIFDENVKMLEKIDDHNYKLVYQNTEKTVSDNQLIYLLSSGTTKGILLYILMVASLQNGFDLLIDEIETHFHKTLVENMLSLYKDKSVNRHNASLIFTTHYCEVLDLFNRQDNIWISKAQEKVWLENMYDNYNLRSELLKSKQFYNNAFDTAVNYEELMNMKKGLLK